MQNEGNNNSRFLRYFISPHELRLRAGWRLLVHAILFLVLLVLSVTAIAMVMFIFGIQPDELLGDLSPLLEIIITLPAFVLSTFIARKTIDRRSLVSLGFEIDSQTLKDLVVGFLIPGLMLGSVFLIQWAVGWLKVVDTVWSASSNGTWLSDLLMWMFIYIAVGFREELLSRGYHLQNIADGLNLPLGILFSSLIFALLHFANPSFSPLSFIGLLAAGYFLAYGWVRTHQLWLPIGLHTGWNFFEGIVFGFPVSGTETFTLIKQENSGPPLITGGGFGPEAGLILLPALLIGVLLIHEYTKKRTAEKNV